MPSSLLVTSASMTRDELPGIVKDTVRPGIVLDGDSLTGSRGIRASPTSDRHTKVTMSVNDDHVLDSPVFFSLFIRVTPPCANITDRC